MLFCCLFVDTAQQTNRYRYQFVGEVMKDILCTKEIIKHATFGIPKGMKNAVSICFAFTVDILFRNENIKNCLKQSCMKSEL